MNRQQRRAKEREEKKGRTISAPQQPGDRASHGDRAPYDDFSPLPQPISTSVYDSRHDGHRFVNMQFIIANTTFTAVMAPSDAREFAKGIIRVADKEVKPGDVEVAGSGLVIAHQLPDENR